MLQPSRVLGSLEIEILVEKHDTQTEQVRDDERPRVPEGIPVWINRMRVLLAAVFDISTGFNVGGDHFKQSHRIHLHEHFHLIDKIKLA